MKLMPRSSSWLASMLSISVVVLLLSIMSAAPAAAATSIYACVNNSSGTIHIVGASASCANNEILLVWNISGTNGTNGTNGTSVTFVDYFSGSTYQGAATGCPNGGAVYAAGTPPVNAYVCNGTNGTNGTNGIDATHPDPPCFDNTNRYVNCGNGTVTDTVTGLIWLQNSVCLGSHDWAAANQVAAGLKDGGCAGRLTDKSSPGDWRLPTKDEWSATFARAGALGCIGVSRPSLTNDAGTGCFAAGAGSSFAGVPSGGYWSSSTFETVPASAWGATFFDGLVDFFVKGFALQVWPVRGGPR